MTREGSSVFVDTVQYPTILDTHTGRFTKRSALSPCTARGSRLPGLTIQGGKHTLQRPKTQPGAKTRKAASVAWHLHAAAGENLPATAAAQRRSVRPVQPLPRRTIFFIQNSLESAQWRQPRHKRKLSRNNIANCKTTQPLRRWQQPVGESCAYASAYVCPRKQARMRA